MSLSSLLLAGCCSCKAGSKALGCSSHSVISRGRDARRSTTLTARPSGRRGSLSAAHFVTARAGKTQDIERIWEYLGASRFAHPLALHLTSVIFWRCDAAVDVFVVLVVGWLCSCKAGSKALGCSSHSVISRGQDARRSTTLTARPSGRRGSLSAAHFVTARAGKTQDIERIWEYLGASRFAHPLALHLTSVIFWRCDAAVDVFVVLVVGWLCSCKAGSKALGCSSHSVISRGRDARRSTTLTARPSGRRGSLSAAHFVTARAVKTQDLERI